MPYHVGKLMKQILWRNWILLILMNKKKYLRDWINVLFGFNWSKGALIKKEIRNKVIKFWNKDFLEELNNKYEKVDNG
jgi:hypothetical protein